MSSDLARLTGASIEVTVGGRTFNLNPVTINDLGEFERRCESRMIARLREVSKDLSPKKRNEFLADGIRNFPKGIEFVAHCQEQMQTLDGTAFLVWLSIRKNHCDVTFEGLCESITLDNYEELTLLLNYASGFSPSGKSKGKKKKSLRIGTMSSYGFKKFWDGMLKRFVDCLSSNSPSTTGQFENPLIQDDKVIRSMFQKKKKTTTATNSPKS